MARIVGVDLPKNKRGVIGLTYIYGIGRSTASKILAAAGISEDIKVSDWTDDQVGAIRATIADMGLKLMKFQASIRQYVWDVRHSFVVSRVSCFRAVLMFTMITEILECCISIQIKYWSGISLYIKFNTF